MLKRERVFGKTLPSTSGGAFSGEGRGGSRAPSLRGGDEGGGRCWVMGGCGLWVVASGRLPVAICNCNKQ